MADENIAAVRKRLEESEINFVSRETLEKAAQFVIDTGSDVVSLISGLFKKKKDNEPVDDRTLDEVISENREKITEGGQEGRANKNPTTEESFSDRPGFSAKPAAREDSFASATGDEDFTTSGNRIEPRARGENETAGSTIETGKKGTVNKDFTVEQLAIEKLAADPEVGEMLKGTEDLEKKSFGSSSRQALVRWQESHMPEKENKGVLDDETIKALMGQEGSSAQQRMDDALADVFTGGM